MSYNLIFVDVSYNDRFPTIVHKMNVITGDYLRPERLSGDFKEQIEMLCGIIAKDKPDKIIFDKFSMGYMFWDSFMNFARAYYYNVFEVDSFGLITYVGMEDND